MITWLKSCSSITAISSLLATLLATPAFAGGDLLLYGGSDRTVFLGCFTCGKFDEASIGNKFSTYGNRFSSESIFNRFGSYGSKFSDESICNPRASYPPVVVDEDGNFYGYLTINLSERDAVEIPELQGLVIGVCNN